MASVAVEKKIPMIDHLQYVWMLIFDTIGGQKKKLKKVHTHKFEKGQMEDYIQYLSTYPTCTEVQKPCLLMFNYYYQVLLHVWDKNTCLVM